MKTLYITDLDGTLLNDDGLVSPASAEIISDLSQQGALITVASARTPASIVPLLEDCNINIPYIVMTGAALFHPESMTYSNLIALDIEDVARVAYTFTEYGINPFFYHFGDDGMLTAYHTPAMTPVERLFYEVRANYKLKRFTFNPILPVGGKYPLIFAIAEDEKIRPIADEFRDDDTFRISYYPEPSLPGFSIIELFANGVSKAMKANVLSHMLGGPRIVAFGDNLNDLPLFEVADVAVAVENAHPEVKRIADIVIGSHNDDAVARFIAEDFASQKQ